VGLYNFQKRFAPFVLDGSKTHTIRAKRKHADKPGNPFHGYTGLRTKNAELLIRSTVVKVEDILIRKTASLFQEAVELFEIAIDGVGLEPDEKNALAWSDGFRSSGKSGAFAEMMEFWDGQLPFRGDLIHWTPINLGKTI